MGLWGSADKMCYYRSAFEIPFDFIDHMISSEKFNFDLFTPSPGSGGRGLQAKIWYHVAAFVILFNLICNMTMFPKGGILNYSPPPQGQGGCRQNISYAFAAIVILLNLICSIPIF